MRPEDDLPPLPLPDAKAPAAARAVEPPTNTGKATRRFRVANRRRQVAALVLARADERTIATALSVSRETVKKDKAVVLARWREAAERDLLDARAIAAAALDADEVRLRAVYDRLDQAGKVEEALEVFDRVLKVQERRAKLLGLDAPEQREIRFPASWRGATVVRDEARPRDDAIAALAILVQVGALDAVVRGSSPEPEREPALLPGPGDDRESREADAPSTDEVRADESDGETGRVPLAPRP